MSKYARSLITTIIFISTTFLISVPVVCADTTGTPTRTSITLSSIKINSKGQILSESTDNAPVTTSTTVPKTTTTDKPTSTTTTTNVKKKKKHATTTTTTTDKANESTTSNTNGISSSNNKDSNGTGEALSTTDINNGNKADTYGNGSAPNTNDTLNGNDRSDSKNDSGMPAGGSSQEAVVKGEQIANPALASKSSQKKAGNISKTNPIGFDVKPYLAIAVLVMLTGITVFGGKSPSKRGRSDSVRNRRTRLS